LIVHIGGVPGELGESRRPGQWVDPEVVGGLTKQAEKANKGCSEQTGE